MINSKFFQKKISFNSLKKFHSFLLSLPAHRKNPADKKHSPQRIQSSPHSVMPIVAFYKRTRAHKRHTSTRKPSAQNTQYSDNNHFRNPISFLVYLKYTPNFGKSQEKYFLDDIRLIFCENIHKHRSSKFFVKSFTIFGITSSKFFVKIFTNFFGKRKGEFLPFSIIYAFY